MKCKNVYYLDKAYYRGAINQYNYALERIKETKVHIWNLHRYGVFIANPFAYLELNVLKHRIQDELKM